MALELCRLAKGRGGGLEIEALESLEPPAAGVSALRDQLYGPDWRENGQSRLTTPRDEVDMAFEGLAGLFVEGATNGPPVSTSLLHRALRAARRVTPFASKAASAAAVAVLKEYGARVGGRPVDLSHVDTTPYAGGGYEALRLHFMLQQRDYVVATHPFDWTGSAP